MGNYRIIFCCFRRMFSRTFHETLVFTWINQRKGGEAAPMIVFLKFLCWRNYRIVLFVFLKFFVGGITDLYCWIYSFVVVPFSGLFLFNLLPCMLWLIIEIMKREMSEIFCFEFSKDVLENLPWNLGFLLQSFFVGGITEFCCLILLKFLCCGNYRIIFCCFWRMFSRTFHETLVF